MKLHIITIGKPKLTYAKAGLEEYSGRLSKIHDLRITHIPDRKNDPESILKAAGDAHKIALVIDGPQCTSEELAKILKDQELLANEVCFLIGGPDGLPKEVINTSETKMGLSRLTFPHDLAMLVLTETLYRSSTINAGHPYHH